MNTADTETPKSILGEFLFWFHASLIVVGLFLGLLLPLRAVLTIFVIHKLHTIVFQGCIITLWQQKIGAIPSDRGFFHYLVNRLFHKSISRSEQKYFDYGLGIVAVIIALLA